ncbi:MAG: ChuX/HutX family heme-like substrate-binding protein [Pseudomonadota bacterium]
MQMQSQLLTDFNTLREQNPKIRAVDAAARLGVSEGALLEARTHGEEVERLVGRGADLGKLIEGLKLVGRVMTLTRNPAVVHETKGEVLDVQVNGAMGQVVGPIDLRMFLRHWHIAYHVTEQTKSGLRKSFQIFDLHGSSVIKIYAVDQADKAAWDALHHAYVDISKAITFFSQPEAKKEDRPDTEIDVSEMRTRWNALEHSHDFFRILADLQVGRQQALRLAGPELAQPLPTSAIRTMLESVSAQEIPIMCFVGNPGCIQIFSGPVRTVAEMGQWLNILDPDFNLHLRQDMVAQAGLVRKPTGLRGRITSLECFNAGGEMVCQFFGARPPGEPEREDWRAAMESLTEEPVS